MPVQYLDTIVCIYWNRFSMSSKKPFANSAQRAASRVEEKLDGRRARGDRTRQLVLENAVQIASVEGLEGLTLGRVASASGVAKATIQTLFGSREELQIRTLDFAVVMIGSAILQLVPPRARGLSRLRRLADAWFAVVEDGLLPGGCLMTAAVTEYRARPGVLRDAVVAHRAHWRARLLDAAREAQADGSLARDADVDKIVYEILALENAANGPCIDRADFDLARETTRDILKRAAPS
jgi:AcrR family transcriptional regulator